MKYRKKPVVVDAIQFTRDNWDEVREFTHGQANKFSIDGRCYCTIHTLEGDHIAQSGDYIIRGVAGEYYPCKPDIFERTYEVVKDEQGT